MKPITFFPPPPAKTTCHEIKMKLPSLKTGVSCGPPGFAGPPTLGSNLPFIPKLKSSGFSGRFYKLPNLS
jgi:hypothetical protein